jgi:F-type H+-transporting ATPase subunit delta
MSDSHSRSILTSANAILAHRYAEALYELADQAGQLDQVADELRALVKLQDENADMRELIRTPRLTRAGAMTLMEKLAAAVSLSPLSSNFLRLLAKNRRLRLFAGMAESYLDMLAKARHEFRVEVQAARPLDSAQATKLSAQLEKVTGGKVQLDVRLEPSLMGGLIVKVGSRQIDASLRGKLARLEQQLKTQQEAA